LDVARRLLDIECEESQVEEIDMKTLLSALLVAIGLSTTVLAQNLPAFEEVDTNRDGAISGTEASIVEGLDLAAADTNQDGVLDRAEYARVAEQD
jgi:hypothetical protein